MAEITAAMVKSLRDKTQLPMMECKKALQKTEGDEAAAIEELRKAGKKTMGKRADRETAEGLVAVYASVDDGAGAILELQCESGPVAKHEEFVQLAKDLTQALATGPGADSADALLEQPSPSDPKTTLRDQFDDLTNRMREVFRVARMERIAAPAGGYSHHTGTVGAIVEVEGGNQQAANDVSMHVAAQNPAAVAKEDLDADAIAKEREILREAALKEGKPENIVDKMVDGRMRNFFAERVLTEQPFIKEESQSVGKYAKDAGMKIKRFIRWELGKE